MANSSRSSPDREGVPEKSALEIRLARAIGQRFQALRLDRGLSQDQVAQAAGISRNQYQLLEAGLSDRVKQHPVNPRMSTLIGLARAHGITTSELVARILDEPPSAAGAASPNVAPVSPVEHDTARKSERRGASTGTPSPPTGSSPRRRRRS